LGNIPKEGHLIFAKLLYANGEVEEALKATKRTFESDESDYSVFCRLG
jgi:hypothetical protein